MKAKSVGQPEGPVSAQEMMQQEIIDVHSPGYAGRVTRLRRARFRFYCSGRWEELLGIALDRAAEYAAQIDALSAGWSQAPDEIRRDGAPTT